jgi:UDP-N-acetylmuramoylalanine--D-glutamate ligase
MKNVFWIAGGARSGVAAALLLASRGEKVFVSEAGTLSAQSKEFLVKSGIPFEENGHSREAFLRNACALILSPAILLSKPLALWARQFHVPILSEIEVASWYLPESAKVVAITGTNGKSTTTAYTSQLLERGGFRSVACGNIGLPFAEAVTKSYNAFVIELSSYQLETTATLKPDVAVLLNLQNDHLQRYESLDEYLKAKWRLLQLVKKEGHILVDETVLEMGLQSGLTLPEANIVVLKTLQDSFLKCPKEHQESYNNANPETVEKSPDEILEMNSFVLEKLHAFRSALPSLTIPLYHELRSLKASQAGGLAFESFEIIRNSGGSLKIGTNYFEKSWDFCVQNPILPGQHNAANLLAASLAARRLGVPWETILLQWESGTSQYRHLPHRLELCVPKGQTVTTNQAALRILSDIEIYNDSKATNVESTLVALKSFASGVRLLIGGEPKGESFLPLVPFFNKPVLRFYPFGKAGPLLEKDLESLKSQDGIAPAQKSMQEACQLALSELKSGEILLLSPACASFDEFQNFEHRGDIFREWAHSLQT